VFPDHSNLLSHILNCPRRRPKGFYVRVGQHFRSADKDTVQTIRVDKWVDHEHYNDSGETGAVAAEQSLAHL